MVLGRRKATPQAMEAYARDEELARQLPELLRRTRDAEAALREAQAQGVDAEEERRLGVAFDACLTDAMRAAYAAQRVAVGPRGYDDRIYRRRQLARPKAKEATLVAERLLTLREAHRLHGVTRVPTRLAA